MEESQKKKNWLIRLWKYFSAYEKIWFFGLLLAGFLLAFLVPDEETFSSTILLVSSLIALASGMMCELLIAKQSRWNFVVSVALVEITEIVICVILKYYASAIVTLVFWIPIDIWSFFAWNKNKDEENQTVTKVKKLNWWQIIVALSIVSIFTVVVGYLLVLIGGEETYLDSLTSAFGMANGILILLRYREQWIAWYLYVICEAVLWILAGQWIMLVLTVGYLTNTTYGLVKWTKYIKRHERVEAITKIESAKS